MKYLNSLDTPCPTDISKRYFIKKSCSVAVFASTFTYHSVIAQTSATEKLLSTLNNKHSAVLIGLAVLDKIDYSLQSTMIENLIMNDLNLTNSDLNLISKTKLAKLFVQQNSVDFDLNRIVSAKGWMLGLTEARLCALAAQYN